MKKQLLKNTLPTSGLMWVLIAMFLMTVCSVNVKAQNYKEVYMDNVIHMHHYGNCTDIYDSVRYHARAGETNPEWDLSGTNHHTGPTYTLPIMSSGDVQYISDNSARTIKIHPVSLVVPTFTGNSLCGATTTNFDAGNFYNYGIVEYLWSNGATTQTINAGAGTYSVTVTVAHDVCSVTHSATNTTYNPMKPNLGPNKTICSGQTTILQLDTTGYISYLWSNGLITPTITVGVDDDYWVKTTNPGGCFDYDTIHVTVKVPPVIPILLVTTQVNNTLPGLGNLMVMWDTTILNAKKVIIERQIPGGTIYVPEDTVDYHIGYAITNANSNQQAQWFKIRIIDSCDNVGAESGYYKSLKASSYETTENDVNVTWEPPMVSGKALLDVVQGFSIYRLDHSTGQYIIVGTALAGNTSFTDINPNPLDSSYFVGADILTGSKSILHSYSNFTKRTDTTSSITENDGFSNCSIYPNPFIDHITISGITQICRAEIFDASGKRVMECDVLWNDAEIRFGYLSRGIYFVKLSTKGNILYNGKILKQ